MKIIQSILKFLDGKKTIITGILITTVGYLGAKGVLDTTDVTFVGAIITIAFGGASVATKVLFTTTPNEIE